MRQLARKFRSLSLVPMAPTPSTMEPRADSLRDHFDGWLSSVDPQVLNAAYGAKKTAAGVNAQRPLSSTDLIRVNRATLRESHDHRHWPPDVVIKFMAADVIRRKR